MEYFLESVKIMLIVGGLSAFISMLVAWIIGLLFTLIRRQRVPATANGDAVANPSSKPANGAPGKVA